MPINYRSSLSRMMLVTGALLTAAMAANAQARPARKQPLGRAVGNAQLADSVNGQIILYCQPGTSMPEVTRLAALVGAAQTNVLLLADCYHLILDGAHQDQGSTAAAVAQLKLEPSVRSVRPPLVFSTTQAATKGGTTSEPNDPRYKTDEQFGLAMLNMPQAWALQKGAAGVTVAEIDSGFDPKHQDAPIFSAGSYDTADNDTDVTADGSGAEFDHGTHTSGVMLANTNNGLGIASVIWQNIPLLAYKIQKKGQPGLDEPGILNAYAMLLRDHIKYNVVACNMSYGAVTGVINTADPEYTAIQQLDAAGIHMVASKGNSSTNIITIPADFPFVIAVSAVNRASKLTYYSNFGKVEVAAPGGEQFSSDNDPNGILSLRQNNGYGFAQGTSDAAPFVTGVMGLIRSVPGVDQARAKDALLSQANHTITQQTQVPDKTFGYGLVDAYASLSKVSNVIEITGPVGINPATGLSTSGGQQVPVPLQTLRPRVTLHMTNVQVVAGVPQFSISVTNSGSKSVQPLISNGIISTSAVDANGPLVTDLYINNLSQGTFSQFDISFRYRAPDMPTSQQQQLVASSTPSDPTLPSLSSTVQFNITPHSFNSGFSFISFPIAETAADAPKTGTGSPRDINAILGGTPVVTLRRWVNTPTVDASKNPTVTGMYAIYSPSLTAMNPTSLASLHPKDTATNTSVVTTPVPAINPLDNPAVPANTLTDATPVGLGYFIYLPSGAAVRTYGRDFSQQTIRVPLHEGWNMVGDPYLFQVAFATTAFETVNGTRYTATDAAANKLILPFIYRAVGLDYTFDTLPNGTMNPWEGNWIYVIPANPNAVSANPNILTMVVSPTSTGVTDASRGVRGPANAAATRSTRSVATAGAKPTVRGAGAWALRLQATANNLVDAHNYIGVSADASAANPYSRAPKPPRMGDHVSLGIAQAGSSATYAQDLRPIGGTQTWDVVVSTNQAASDTSVAWPDAHSLPRSVRLTLTDKVTGQSVDMRSRSAYHFDATGASTRAFTITAQPGDTRDRIAFNSVVVTPHTSGRGTGAGSVYQIDYELSGPAEMEVTILNTGGRVITQVEQGRAAVAGVNRSVWNGRDSQNRTLTTGTYIVKMVARTAEGRISQYHYPLTITR